MEKTMTKKQKIAELENRIAELMADVYELTTELETLSLASSRLNQAHDDLTRRNRQNAIGVERLTDATNHTINRLLRQNISQMTHSERNHQNNRTASELMQILRIVGDIVDMTDIPF